ncbi:torsin-1A-like isoform X1 [Ambystoma mexicanum]|uniref:torsin-1A-like isoform X1 n=1 Tax=Ambystoma mexicanum TaxID=8296 RepID=UPI0037E85C4D
MGLRVCGLLLLLPALRPALEPLTTGVLLSAVGGMLLVQYGCHLTECCPQDQVLDLSGLQLDLSLNVYGQPMATALILQALKTHMDTKDPAKPLVFSFHGWTGTGKSFVSNIISKNLYKKGAGSKFVHLLDANLHFPHKKYVHLYKKQLQQWLLGNLSSCARSLFIFSEMDVMPPGLVDVVAPFLYGTKDKPYGKAIFIFINNVGANKINHVALDFWNRGKRREDIELKDLEQVLAEEAFKNQKSGFWNSVLIRNNLIDYFVPFLPLERLHVEMCIKAELQSRGYTQNPKIIKAMLNNLVDFPSPEKIYASNGCKTVSSRLLMYV